MAAFGLSNQNRAIYSPPTSHGNAGTPAVAASARITITDIYGFLMTSFHCSVVSSATVGNRIIGFDILDASNNIVYTFWPGNSETQAASLTNVYQSVLNNNGVGAVAIASVVIAAQPTLWAWTGFNPFVIPNGFKFAPRDFAAIDAAADTYDLTIIGTALTLG